MFHHLWSLIRFREGTYQLLEESKSFFSSFFLCGGEGKGGRRVVLPLLCIDAYESQSAYLFKCEINKAGTISAIRGLDHCP